MKLLREYWITVVLITAILSLAYTLFPAFRPELIEEDRFMENLTALLFFVSFFVGILWIWMLPTRRLKRVYLVIPCLALLSFLSEISFGIRIFKIDSSYLPQLNNTSLDGVHDLLAVAYKSIKEVINRDNYWLVALIVIAFIAILGFGVWKYRKLLINIFQQHFPFLFILFAVGFGILSASVDLSILDAVLAILSVNARKVHPYLLFIEELSEMFVALSFVFASCAIKVEGAVKSTKIIRLTYNHQPSTPVLPLVLNLGKLEKR